MSGTQETALTLARELSGAGEAEEALLELLCQAESCALAESLRRTAERLMAPFAVPDDFCFRGVRE